MELFSTYATAVAFIVAISSGLGLPFLLFALLGLGIERFGLLYRLTVQERWIDLIGGNVIMAAPLLLTHFMLNTTAPELWHAASSSWQTGIVGRITAVVVWIILVSPLISLVSTYRIWKDARRQAHIMRMVLAP